MEVVLETKQPLISKQVDLHGYSNQVTIKIAGETKAVLEAVDAVSKALEVTAGAAVRKRTETYQGDGGAKSMERP